MASYANGAGGYLVFGIEDNPRRLTGMTNRRFEDIDPAVVSTSLNSKFAPEIKWHQHIHGIGERRFGLIYTEEAHSKPIIATSDAGDDVKEGSIYYRYRGNTGLIKHAELRDIIDGQRAKEQALWMKHLRRISKIGAENAAVFNPFDGTVEGKSGVFVIDQEILPHLKFIREGEFNEVAGAPTLRIVGDAEFLGAGPIGAIRVERQPVVLREAQIIEDFLAGARPENPTEYIREICLENTGNMPVYYYAHLAELTLQDCIDFVGRVPSIYQGKRILHSRLTSADERIDFRMPEGGRNAALRRTGIRAQLLRNENLDEINSDNLNYACQAIRSFNIQEIDRDYLCGLLSGWYRRFWHDGGTGRTELRNAICHVDKVLYRDALS